MSCNYRERNNLRIEACGFETTAQDGDPITIHSTPAITPTNDALAANLSVAFPKTPHRVTPNSAKRRRQIPDLSRSNPTSSHGTKISKIFQDAAATLQELRTPSSPNIKKFRLPLSQTRTTKFGNTGWDNAANSTDLESSSLTNYKRESPSERHSGRQQYRHMQGLRDHQKLSTPMATPGADPSSQALPKNDQIRLPILSAPESPIPNSSTAHVSLQASPEDKEREPISSGFATPSALRCQPPDTPEEIRRPEFEHWQLPWSSSIPGSDGGDYLPSRGPPLALPASFQNTMERHGVTIEDWLKDIDTLINTDDNDPKLVQMHPSGMGHVNMDTPPDTLAAMANKPRKNTAQIITPRLKRAAHKIYNTSSDKENVSPSKSSPSPIRPPVTYCATTPSRFSNNRLDVAPSPADAVKFIHPLTPQGHLKVLPKRKKARARLELEDNAQQSGKDFTIHDDQVANALADLSPDVELRRKGRRPKRERCMSYWDEDILQPGSPCPPLDADENKVREKNGRKVLGVSPQTAELTREKPFIMGAESAAFNFQPSR